MTLWPNVIIRRELAFIALHPSPDSPILELLSISTSPGRRAASSRRRRPPSPHARQTRRTRRLDRTRRRQTRQARTARRTLQHIHQQLPTRARSLFDALAGAFPGPTFLRYLALVRSANASLVLQAQEFDTPVFGPPRLGVRL